MSTNDANQVINYLNASPSYSAQVSTLVAGSGPPSDLRPDEVDAAIQLMIFSTDGQQVSSVQVGDEFELRAYLNVSGPEGVEAVGAHTDVIYSSAFVSAVTNSANVGLVGSTVGGGLIDEAGRVIYGTGTNLIFSKTFAATKKGLATFTADAADLFGHDIYVLGLYDALPLSQVTFGSTTLQVKARRA